MNLHDKHVLVKAGKYVTRQKHEEARGKFCHQCEARETCNHNLKTCYWNQGAGKRYGTM